jgi:hypothetical protein
MRTETPAVLPTPNAVDSAAPPSKGTDPPPPSLYGFVRIAAQVEHALNNYKYGMQPDELEATIGASDSLAYLPDLPKTDDPTEARAYIEKAAARVEALRLQQQAGLTL